MSRKNTAITIFIILLFSVLSIPMLYSPLFIDESAFLYVSKNMSLDKLPYRDFIDNKGPVAYLFFKAIEALFPQNIVLFRSVFLILTIIAGFALKEIVKKVADEDSSLIAFAIYFALYLIPFEFTFGTTEPLGMFFMLVSLALFLRFNGPHFQLISGLLLSFSVMTNVIFMPSLLPFAILHLWKKVRIVPSFAYGLLFGLSLFLFPMAMLGILPDFFFWYFNYNFAYIGGTAAAADFWARLLFQFYDIRHYAVAIFVFYPFFPKSFQNMRHLRFLSFPSDYSLWHATSGIRYFFRTLIY